ncbi:hypothetical protein [Nocardioides sp. Leaf285]|uniref:hypothetical protein n=1 Tax=Nocardioides sp. Leaf285 TaxID=1736322 RepID=UPI0007027394|nr:hypothetical protein [Nocardioides sp. Leaf285]KQP64228.1 hypothetical protein ASF47_09475 [Nocardioides sp. Leaf285]
MRHPLRRASALAAAPVLSLALLAVPGLTTPAQAAAGDLDPVAAQRAGDWLAGQVDDGLLTYRSFGAPFTDYGLSIDAELALAAVGGQDATVDAIAAAVAEDPTVYTDYAYPFDGAQYAGRAAGAVAKALVGLQAAGVNPATVEEIDLVGALEAQTADTGATAGRIADVATKDGEPDPTGDFANTLGQAFAVRGLQAAGSDEADAATDFLLLQQCGAGFFRQDFAPATATDQACGSGADASVDATAQAVLSLLPQAGDAEVDAALADAAAWLAGFQNANGSFDSGTDATAFPGNANSTGLAGWALGDLADLGVGAASADAAADAAAWLRARQVAGVGDCNRFDDADLGAVAYDDTARKGARTDGVRPADRGQFLRATAQAAPALASSTDTGEDAVAAKDLARKGRALTVEVTGLAPGAKLCLTGSGAGRGETAGATAGRDGSAGLTVSPERAGTATYEVRGESGVVGSVDVRVLGPKTLGVDTARRAERGGSHVVTVSGLVPGERTVVTFRGSKSVARADEEGRVVTEVRVSGALGLATLRAKGQFADRTGEATVRVVR